MKFKKVEMMKKVEHTPGPWIVSRIDSAKFNVRADQESIAMVYANLGSPTLQDKEGQGEANAQLIGAVPDLLEALKDAHAMLTLLGVDLKAHEEGRRIIDAIAKAGGDYLV